MIKGTKSYENWEEIPLSIINKIYLFNVTNVEEVLRGGKHVLQEVGPFVYEEKRKKFDVSWNDDQSKVTYRQRRTWFFRPDLSKGSLDDFIYHLNVPLVVGMTKFIFRSFTSCNIAECRRICAKVAETR